MQIFGLTKCSPGSDGRKGPGVLRAPHPATTGKNNSSKGPSNQSKDAQVIQKAQGTSVILLLRKRWWRYENLLRLTRCNPGAMYLKMTVNIDG